MRTRVKFCGITSEADAMEAVAAGADSLGFVISKSPRQIHPKSVRDIVMKLPPMVTSIGVFVNENAAYVEQVSELCKFNAIQLQGAENLDEFSFKIPVIKAYKINAPHDLKQLNIDTRICACLFDSKSHDAPGGTGITFDWNIIKGTIFPKPLILAGGLPPANVSEAIRVLRPYAVDVSSGIEKAKGIKDVNLMHAFVQQVRMADRSD